MARIEPRKDLRNGLALCVACFGEYRPMETSSLECGHAVCLACDPDYTMACPLCTPRAAIVMCRVSGGVTGTREAPLKDKNGQVRWFDSLADAEAEARRLREARRTSTTDFHYWAEEGV